jgi:hypothetical protein
MPIIKKKISNNKKMLNSHCENLDNLGLVYFGCNITAVSKGDQIKKHNIYPKGWNLIEKPTMLPVYDKITEKYVACNGVALNTKLSNISCIDVDEPEKCTILEKLKTDCQYVIKSRKGYHFLFKNNDLPRNKICGVVDINTSLLNFCPEYKHRETKETIGKYSVIKSNGLIEMPKYAYDYCSNMIKQKFGSIKSVSKKEIKDFVQNEVPLIEKFDIELMTAIYQIHFDKGHFGNAGDWVQLCFLGRHLNNTEAGFKLFLDFSKKAEGYEDEPEEKIRNHFYNTKYVTDFNEISALVKTRRLSNSKYNKLIDPILIGNNKYETIKFNRKFIYPLENDEDFNTEIVKFNNWLHGDNEVLAISSPYGSGKTFAFKKLIPSFERILFITYRQSLADSLQEELNELYNFEHYKNTQDNLMDCERLIIQLDSLHKIGGQSFLNGYRFMESYDLIVLDESEGLLRHFNAETLKNKEETFDILTDLCKESNKVLVLDGDLGERSLDFLHKTIKRKTEIYKNEFKPITKHIQFTRDIDFFDNHLDESLKAGKKIVFPCMSAKLTEQYYLKYKDIYNVILHNSIEKNKTIIRDFKNQWKKADLLIYSPSVESGVDFDEDWFDIQYGLIQDGSTTAAGYSQMLHRVRKLKDTNTLIYIGKTKYNASSFLYYPASLEEHFFKHYRTESGLGNIQLHNKCEELNKINYLLNDFIRVLNNKHYTHEFLEEKKYETPEKQDNALIKILPELENLQQHEYEDLIKKQNGGYEITREESYHLKKYFMSKKFLVPLDEFDQRIVEERLNKEHWIDNYNSLNDDKLNYRLDNNFIKDKADIWKSIIDVINNTETQDDAIKGLSKILSDDDRRIKQLFPFLPKKPDTKKIISNINCGILEDCGVKIDSLKTKPRLPDGTRKTIVKYQIIVNDLLVDYQRRCVLSKEKKCLID